MSHNRDKERSIVIRIRTVHVGSSRVSRRLGLHAPLVVGLVAAALSAATACTSDEGSGDEAAADTTASGVDSTGGVEDGGTMCEPGMGEFEPLIDWSDPVGLEFSGAFVAVHAVHMGCGCRPDHATACNGLTVAILERA